MGPGKPITLSRPDAFPANRFTGRSRARVGSFPNALATEGLGCQPWWWRFYTQTLITHGRFHTQTLLHTGTYTEKHTLLHTRALGNKSFNLVDAFKYKHFTHKSFWPYKRFEAVLLFHSAFTHKAFTHRSVYRQKLSQAGAFAQTLLHTQVFTDRSFTHRRFYTHKLSHTQKLLHKGTPHTGGCTHGCFYTESFTNTHTHTPLHTRVFGKENFPSTHTRFYTQTLLYTRAFSPQKLLHRHKHTEAFTHRKLYNRNFCTDTLCTNAFADRSFYTDAFTHRIFDTQHPKFFYREKKLQFSLSFWWSTFISCERVAKGTRKSQFSFWRSNLVSCERVAADTVKSHFCLSFWRSSLVSCERVAFRAVLLALPLPLPSEEK